MRILGGRRLTSGDVLIVVAVSAVGLALLLPTMRTRAFHVLLNRTVGEVEAVRRAATAFLDSQGSWPEAAPPGQVPRQLVGRVAPDLDWANDLRALEWTRWSVVDSVEVPVPVPEVPPGDAPPPEALVETRPRVGEIGAIVVHSSDPDLLGELLVHFGRDASFVRDSTWTLVLPRRARR